MAVYLFDADLNGNDGIAHLVESGKVVHIPCNSFDTFDRAAHGLLTKVTANDFVIVDTLTTLAETARGDVRLGGNDEELLWDRRDQLTSDDYGRSYNAAQLLIMRRLLNLRKRNAHIITTLHEAEREDDGTKLPQRAPSLNQAFYVSLIAKCSDILRMTAVMEPILNSDGSVKVPVGTRLLQLNMSSDVVIKKQVKRELSNSTPKYIVDPTWDKLTKALGKVPSWLVLYGPPGVGKTTLATDMVETHTPKEVKQ